MAAKGSSRVRRALLSSLLLVCLAAVLAASNSYMQAQDRKLALGPSGPAQLDFFVSAVDRPDIPIFFKRLSPAEKLKVATHLGAYDRPQIARLAAIWLADFDVDARKELSKVLTKLAATQPDAVVAELKNTGGFQKIAVFDALRSQGDRVLPKAVEALKKPELRVNAVTYLSNSGEAAGTLVETLLDSPDKDTRLAAADTLGRLGNKVNGPKLLQMYQSAAEAEKGSYLAALANLGWNGAEPLMSGLVKDRSATNVARTAAALGLGRIATPSAVRTLETVAHEDSTLTDDAIAALQLAGDQALGPGLLSGEMRIKVAAGIQSVVADNAIGQALSDPHLRKQAAEAAKGRPRLATTLASRLAELDAGTDGRTVASFIDALFTTDAGRAAVEKMRNRPGLAGFIARAEEKAS